MQLTKEQALRVFDILVTHAGAHEDLREQFVHYVTQPCNFLYEFRFQGQLGHGGKIYITRSTWTVGCYTEDESPAHQAIIKKVNALLEIARDE
jgi:hypothetical protein